MTKTEIKDKTKTRIKTKNKLYKKNGAIYNIVSEIHNVNSWCFVQLRFECVFTV